MCLYALQLTVSFVVIEADVIGQEPQVQLQLRVRITTDDTPTININTSLVHSVALQLSMENELRDRLANDTELAVTTPLTQLDHNAVSCLYDTELESQTTSDGSHCEADDLCYDMAMTATLLRPLLDELKSMTSAVYVLQAESGIALHSLFGDATKMARTAPGECLHLSLESMQLVVFAFEAATPATPPLTRHRRMEARDQMRRGGVRQYLRALHVQLSGRSVVRVVCISHRQRDYSARTRLLLRARLVPGNEPPVGAVIAVAHGGRGVLCRAQHGAQGGVGEPADAADALHAERAVPGHHLPRQR